MPAGEALDDEYVVSLLLKDAEANQKRYISNGLGSLLSKRPSVAPKPNTRFLRNIIKETDSHNAALKAKEEEESRARLRNLKEQQRPSKRSRDEAIEEGSSKRRRGQDKPGRWANVLGGLGERSGRHAREMNAGARGQPGSLRNDERRHRSRSRERAVDDERRKRVRRRSSESSGERRKPRRKESRSHKGRPSRLTSRSRSPRRKQQAPRTTSPSPEDDSDPLEEIIGPRPPPKVLPRGRGAYKTASIDDRFDPSYDPRADVDLAPDDGDRDDWDMALEALRDRAKWRIHGAERLRAAGFGEDELKKWEGNKKLLGSNDSSAEKDVADVRWRKEGEGREWDHGKLVTGDRVELKADWGRLKDT